MPHIFSGLSAAGFVKHSFKVLLILLTLVTFGQFLTSISPIYIQAAEKEAVKSQEANALKTQQDKQDVKAKNDKRYREVEYDNTVNNCSNPIGFEEDNTKKEANTKYFWVPKNKDVPKNLTRSSNPEYFTQVVCSYTNKVNYKDNGVFKDIDNRLKEIDKKDAAAKSYKYTNSGNDFKIYFSENPNQGFWFKSDKSEIKVTKVSVSGNNLSFNPKDTVKLEGNTITYSEILPSIDLQYKVDNEGVSKYFILKNKKALESDLTKIEFEIDTGTKKLVKKNEATEKITLETTKKLTTKGDQDLEKKTKNNQELKIADIQAQIDSQLEVKVEIDRDINSATKEIKEAADDVDSKDGKRMEKADKLDEKNKKELEKQLQKNQQSKLVQKRNTELQDLKKKLENGSLDAKNKTKVKDEVDKILEASDVNDTIQFSDESSLKLETPYTFEASSGAIKADTFKISQDGKTLTIYPDTSYLNDKNRQFPIVIDPRLVGGNYTAQDVFYNSYAPTSPRGSNNAFHLLVGGNPCINVGTGSCAWMGDSRTAITFNIPNEVLSSANVVWANFRLRQYSSNGGSFTARVRNACGFTENIVTWNSQPCIANDYGSIGVGTTNCGGAGCGGDVWSSDIANLVRDNLNGGSRQINLVLHDDNESVNRGAAFCSKDGWNPYHPCNNGTNQGPYLQVYLNERPSAPIAELPDNGDYIGKCDKSVTPNTGNCNSKLGVDYKISNINDGDGDLDCNLANVRIVNRNSTFNPNWSEFFGPVARGCPAGNLTRTYNILTSNGRYDWAAINRDNYGLESSNWSNTRKFSVDTQPPVRTALPSFPEYSRGDKLSINANIYGDNLFTKYTIDYTANRENTNYIKFSGGNNDLVLGVNGSNIELTTPTANSNQKWFLSGNQFKLENTFFCLSAIAADNGLVNTTNCLPGPGSQDWIQKPSGELALKDNQNFCLITTQGGTTVGTRLTMKACGQNQFNQKFELVRLTGISRRVDVNNGGGNASDNIHLWEPNDGNNQQWALESTGKIRGVLGKCLNLTGIAENSRVNYWDCSDDSDLNQKWEYTSSKELKNIGVNKCLDVSGGNGNFNGIILVVATCSQSFSQKWNLNQVSDTKLYAKFQEDSSGLGDVFFLKQAQGKDFTGNCISSGCNIIIWDHNGNLNQRLIYTKNQEIKPFENQSVCADAASLSNGGNVYWFSCHGGDNQKWIFDGAKNLIKSKANQGFCVDNSSGGRNNGNNIQMWVCQDNSQNQQFRVEFENGKLLKNDLDYPNQQLQYNAQVLKTNNPVADTDYYFGDTKNSFQSNSTIQFPNGNQTGALPEGDVWVRARARDRNQDGNANISEFTTASKVTIDNSRPQINDFAITGNKVFSSSSQPTPLTIKYNVTEKNFRNTQLNVVSNLSVLDYQNSYNDASGNYGEATRVISADGGQITQMLWNNNLYQAKTLNNKIYTRTYRANVGFDEWKETDSQTNEIIAGSNPATKRLVTTQNSVSMTVYQNKLWQFIRGFNTGTNTIETNSLYYRSSSDGVIWNSWTRLDAGILNEPAVISFNSKLLMYARGGDNQLYQNSFNGTSWSGWTVNGQYTVAKPTAVIFNNKVYQSYQTNSSGYIYNRDSSDGLNWSSAINNGGQTPGEITMTAFGDKLVQALRSYNPADVNAFTNPCYKYLLNGTTWSDWTCDSRLTNKTITLQKYNNKLYSSILSNDGKIYTKSTTDGITWTEFTLLDSANSTEVVPPGIKVMDVIDKCLDSTNNIVPCNYLNLGSDLNNQTLTFSYTPPVNLAEGKYELKPVVFDKTCTGKTLSDVPGAVVDNLDNCNMIMGEGLENFIRVDNSPAKIGISSPFDGAWVSDNKFKIEGGLGGFNNAGKEDSDVSKFYICKAINATTNCIDENNSSQDKTATLNSLKNFSYQTNLSEGANYFRFKTVDSIGNQNSVVGNSNSNSTKDFWTLNYENTPPIFDKVELRSNTAGSLTNDGVINGSSEADQKINFRFKDNGSDVTKISGIEPLIDVTTNQYKLGPTSSPKNFNISLIRDVDGSGYKEIALYRDGINITNDKDDPRLVDEFKCTPEAAALNSYINCEAVLKNLKLDGNYKLFIKTWDRAGNPICNTDYQELDSNFSCKFNNSQNIQIDKNSGDYRIKPEFVIKTKTYLEIQKPQEAFTTLYTNLEFKAKAEKGNIISIVNDKLNRKIEFKNDLSSNQTLPKEYNKVGTSWVLVADKDIAENRVFSSPSNKITIECGGNFVNHDNLSETKDVEYCSYSLILNQLGNQVLTPAMENSNTVSSADIYGNVINKTIKVIVDINSLNLSSIPDYTAISPNGDGKFDKIIFTNSATVPDPNDSTKTIDFDQVTSYTAKITNSSNQVVWQKSDGLVGGKIPSTIEFNGTYNSQPIADGEYNYSLILTRNAGATVVTTTTKPLAVSIQRVVDGKVVINSPASTSEYTTTRGVINVQGELPASGVNDEWKVDLCFKLVDSNQAVSPNCVINSSVNGVKGGSNKSFGYLKPVTITNSLNTLTDYQARIIVNTQELILAGKLKNNCDDLRIKDTDKTTDLPFWIEQGCNTNNTIIWLKLPVLGLTKTFYLGYGSAFATTPVSNGNAVFEFFDDFNNLNNWQHSFVNIVDGTAYLQAGRTLEKVFTNLPADYKVDFRYKNLSPSRDRMYLTTPGLNSPIGFDYGDFESLFWNGFSGVTLPADTWVRGGWENTPYDYVWKFNNESGVSLFRRNTGYKVNNLNRLAFGLDTGNLASRMQIDWLYIRKYSAVEPYSTITNSEINLGSNDSFSTIITVPTEAARYRLTATATSKTGLVISSDSTKSVPIKVDLANSISSVSLTSNLEGLNSQQELTNFMGSNDPAAFNINKLKTLNLNLNVTSGTDAVAIDFAKYENIYAKNTNDTADYSSIFRSDGRVALINNTTETNAKFNPATNPNIKQNLYTILSGITATTNLGQLLRSPVMVNNVPMDYNKPCTQNTCNWQYNMVYPYWLSGGIYELRLRAYKGDSFEEQTVAFEINGQTNTQPKLLRTDKQILTDRCEFATNLLATNPTNPAAIGLSGSSLTFAQNCSNPLNIENTPDKIKSVNSANYTGSTGYRYATANSVKTLVEEKIGVSNDPLTGLTGPASIVNADQYSATTGISSTIYTNSENLKLYLAGEPNKLINFRLKPVYASTTIQNQIDGKVDPAQPTIDICKAKLGDSIPDSRCSLYNQLNYNITRNSEFETKDTGILEKNLILPKVLPGNEVSYVLTVWNCTIEPALLANGTVNPKAGQCTSELPTTKYTHYKIIADKKTPVLDWVKTNVDSKSNPNAINPWIRSGDTVNVTLKTSEHLAVSTPTATSSLITQAGYKAEISKVITNTTTTTATSSTPKLCSEAYSQSQLINQVNVDPKCVIAYNTSVTSTASFTPITDIEGTYYFHLYLTDLAGNSSIVTNDVSVDNGSLYDAGSVSPIATSSLNKDTINSINTLDKYLAGLTTIAKNKVFFSSNQDIDRVVFATPNKIDVNFLSDPTKKDALGNIITTGLTSNQLAILNGVLANAANTGFGKDTNSIPASYPYTKTQVTACIYPDPATNPANPNTPTNLPCQTDIAGNVTNASGSIRNQSLDFRLFVDNTLPDKVQAFDATNFCDNDGLKSDGKTPERDRLSPVAQATQGQCSTTNYDGTRFVIRGNQVTLKGSFEKNQRVALKVIKKNKLTPQIEDVKYVFPDSSTSSACTPSGSQTTYGAEGYQSAQPPLHPGDKQTKQSIITKYKDNCNYEFIYNIVDDGSQNNELDLNNYYDFSFYPIDKAGNVPIPSGPNTSISSSTLTLYHDKVKPNIPINSPPCLDNTTPTNPIINPNGIPNGNNNQNLCTSPLTTINYNQPDKIMLGCEGAVLATGSPRPDCNQLNSYNQYDITNQTNIEIKTTGERQSDLQQQLGQKPNQVVNAITTNPTENKLELTPDSTTNLGIRDDNNNLITDTTQLNQTRILKMGNTGTYSDNISTFNLGKPTTDEADSATNPNCITTSSTPIKNRRVGTCNNGDGIYNILERNIDTAGNRGNWVSKTVERDTVKPVTPTISITKIVDGLGNPNVSLDDRLSINLSGEQYTELKIEIFKNNNLLDTRKFELTTGDYSNTDLIGKLDCGANTYFVKAYTIDRAGNISQTVTSNSIISSLQCPSCGGNTLNSPIKNSNAYIAFPYGYSKQYYNGTKFHTGADYNGVPMGENIYPAFDGVVVYSTNYRYLDSQHGRDEANYIDISHGNGMITRYVHLMHEIVNYVNVGDTVTTNTIIGRMGATGNADGPHLHFEVRINGKHQNPEPFLQGKGSTPNLGNLNQVQRDKFGCVDYQGGLETEDQENPNPNNFYNSDIEAEFIVSNTNQSEWETNKDEIHNGLNSNNRKIRFKIVSDNKERIQNAYDNNNQPQVWIVIHGWYANPNTDWSESYMIDTANILKAKKPNDIVLILDWREASGSCCQISGGNYRAAKWIDPVSIEAKKKLNSWGLRNGSKINFVGHSLGTLLSTQIAEKFGGGNKSIMLDPASELSPGVTKGYDFNGNLNGDQGVDFYTNNNYRNYFKSYFEFSRAFTGKKSIAGSLDLTESASESYLMSFDSTFCPGGIPCFGDEHFRVIDVFNRINTDTPIYNNKLSMNDMNYSNSKINNSFGLNTIDNRFEGQLNVIQYDQPKRTWVENVQTKVYDLPDISVVRAVPFVYGTNQFNEIRLPWNGESRTDYYGGAGEDKFWMNKQSVGTFNIYDFDSQDKLVLDPYMKGQYKLKVEQYSLPNDIAYRYKATITNTRNTNRIVIQGNGVDKFNQSGIMDQTNTSVITYN